MAKEISKIFESSTNEAKKFAQSILNIFSRFRSEKIVVETEVKGGDVYLMAGRDWESLPQQSDSEKERGCDAESEIFTHSGGGTGELTVKTTFWLLRESAK